MPSIDEYEEIRLVNANGETIELNPDQLIYLAKLCHHRAAEAENLNSNENNKDGQERDKLPSQK